MTKPLILVTNDDGVNAPGLQILTKIARKFGDVAVVAPEFPMSGSGHAVTVREPLRVTKVEENGSFKRFSCNGTPVDCVKLGEQIVLKRKPDLLLSGINHGSNAAVNVVYSGTMAAVIESAIGGVTSIGFSLTTHSWDADFSASEKYVNQVVSQVLDNGLPDGVCLNVNIPSINDDEIRGIKICRQAKSKWIEQFDERKDPGNRKYYWLKGIFELMDPGKDTDIWALRNNYVSVVPVHADLTAHHAINNIKKWNLDV
jgi:5'-nucleotidase